MLPVAASIYFICNFLRWFLFGSREERTLEVQVWCWIVSFLWDSYSLCFHFIFVRTSSVAAAVLLHLRIFKFKFHRHSAKYRSINEIAAKFYQQRQSRERGVFPRILATALNVSFGQVCVCASGVCCEVELQTMLIIRIHMFRRRSSTPPELNLISEKVIWFT